MQFFYIDYINNGKKERNIGFLRVENDGISVGLRGVPAQCGDSCRVYAVDAHGRRVLLGAVPIKNGYGMKKMKLGENTDFVHCMRIEVPLYGTRRGECVLRYEPPGTEDVEKPAVYPEGDVEKPTVSASEGTEDGVYEEIYEDKWQQLLSLYPQVHISPGAQSIVIRPKDTVILAGQYHGLASNSFVLHAYYNYRQLLLFRYTDKGYYLGVPGVYYEREQRIAQMFGFEGFENGEARMQEDADNKLYRGCFGYYMKRVEI